MLIINGKRMLIIFMCLILAISFGGVKKNNNTIETVALPVENKVIILDAGHGFPDERSI